MDDGAVDRAIARLRAGEVIQGSFWHEHGLPAPLVQRASMRFDVDAFVLVTSWEEFTGDGYETLSSEPETSRLDEAAARMHLAQSSALRAACVS